MKHIICEKTLAQWEELHSEIKDLVALREMLWKNPQRQRAQDALAACSLGKRDIEDAEERLARFAPFIAQAFPVTQPANGSIESPLREIPRFAAELRQTSCPNFQGRWFVKCDNALPVSGSIKARGGIYEVLYYAERLAAQNGLLTPDADYRIFLTEPFRELFSRHSLIAGSTGNLGLSIGIMSAKLGFHTAIHMSADARTWKKDLLRSLGVEVIEHSGDYSVAVEQARKTVGPNSHFVDDENSQELFLGYAVAACRLSQQLREGGIYPDAEHPLFVYLPCGVGGGPGGVTFGLKTIYQDAVHCFFAEPTYAPCMTLGIITGCHDQVSIQDFGIDKHTCADGLAVGRPSRFVGRLIQPFLDGCYTVQDMNLYKRLYAAANLENLYLEPSALAGFFGPDRLWGTSAGQQLLAGFDAQTLANATHVSWATGGGMVPQDVMQQYYDIGAEIAQQEGGTL